MIINEWIEPYTLLMGIHSMGVITEVLCESGLVYAPFLVVIFKSIVEAATQGEDEGNAGELAVKFLRKELLIMFPVFMLAFVPMTSSGVKFDSRYVGYMCDDNTRKVDSPNSSQQSMLGNFGGGYNRMPAWWMIVHDYSSTFTNSVIAMTPCAADLRMAIVNVQANNLDNSYDQGIAGEWERTCLNPAIGKATEQGALPKDAWAGSPELRQFYRQEQNTVVISRETATSAGLPISDLDGAEVRVNCDTAYQHLENAALTSARNNTGDSLQLLANVKPGSDAEKRIAMNQVAKLSNSPWKMGDTNNLSGQIDREKEGTSIFARMAAMTGMAIGNIMKAPDAIVLKNTTPVLVCVIQMMLIMVIPILLVFSGFSIKTALTLSAVYFGLEFTLSFVNLATWMDNTLNLFFLGSDDYVGGGIMDGASTVGKTAVSPLQESILLRVGYTSYDLLPKLWMGMLAYVGIKAGTTLMAGGSSVVQQNTGSFSTITRLTSIGGKATKAFGEKAAGDKKII